MGQGRNLDAELGIFPPLKRLDPLCIGIQGLQRER